MARRALSVAMIARNEAQHLPECLACLERWVDEICVVDTGSEDGTPELARLAGCRVAHRAWDDDFAAARNASLDLCSGDWILVIDPDERIDADDAPRLRALTEGPGRRCYRLCTRNYTNAADLAEFVVCVPDLPEARGFAGWYPSWKVRLFPRLPGLRFEGAVHELINDALARAGVPIETSDIPIHHYPLLREAGRIREKQELYIRLGRRKADARPDDPQPRAELGHQYVEIGDYAAAVAAYRDALRLAPGNAPLLKDLGAALFLAGLLPEARKALEIAVRVAPGLTDAWRNLGVVLAQQGDWAGAARMFEQGLAVSPGDAVLERYLLEARRNLGADPAQA